MGWYKYSSVDTQLGTKREWMASTTHWPLYFWDSNLLYNEYQFLSNILMTLRPYSELFKLPIFLIGHISIGVQSHNQIQELSQHTTQMDVVSLVHYMFRLICELSSGLDINTDNRKIITAT